MQIIPKDGPAVAQPQGSSSRSRAIEAFNKASAPAAAPQAQEHPVLNPSKVSPEEMTAVKAPSDQGQNRTVEASSDPATPPLEATDTVPPAKEEPLSAQYAQLARKEKAIRAKVQQIQAQELAAKSREEALKAREQSLQTDSSLKDRLAKDPIAVLNELGITYDQLTGAMVNQPSPEQRAYQDAISKLEAKIAALEDGQSKAKEEFTNQQKQSYEQAVNDIRSNAKKLVSSDEAYESIRETGSVEEVVDLIKKTWETDQVLLTVEEAAQAVEEEISERLIRFATKINKVKSKFQPVAPATTTPQREASQPQSDKPAQTKTLTNAIGTSRQLSAKERAILAFKGQLNK